METVSSGTQSAPQLTSRGLAAPRAGIVKVIGPLMSSGIAATILASQNPCAIPAARMPKRPEPFARITVIAAMPVSGFSAGLGFCVAFIRTRSLVYRLLAEAGHFGKFALIIVDRRLVEV